jgi:hypothetical protein
VRAFSLLAACLFGASFVPACEEEQQCAPGSEFCGCFMGTQCTNGLVCDAGYCVPYDADACDPGFTTGCSCPDGSSSYGLCPPSGSVAEIACDCSAVGQACEVEGTVFCGMSSDGARTQLLVYCEGGALVERFQCPPPQPCNEIQGNTSVACGNEPLWVYYGLEGGPCASENAAVCTFDQSAVLLCEQGVWQVSQQCADNLRQCSYVADGDYGIMCLGASGYCTACIDA